MYINKLNYININFNLYKDIDSFIRPIHSFILLNIFKSKFNSSAIEFVIKNHFTKSTELKSLTYEYTQEILYIELSHIYLKLINLN